MHHASLFLVWAAAIVNRVRYTPVTRFPWNRPEGENVPRQFCATSLVEGEMSCPAVLWRETLADGLLDCERLTLPRSYHEVREHRSAMIEGGSEVVGARNQPLGRT